MVYWQHTIPGWSSPVARWAHNPKVAGSNPAPGTAQNEKPVLGLVFHLSLGYDIGMRWYFVGLISTLVLSLIGLLLIVFTTSPASAPLILHLLFFVTLALIVGGILGLIYLRFLL